MIWTDPIEEFPDDGYIHPLHDGKGYDGRVYRPVWHATHWRAHSGNRCWACGELVSDGLDHAPGCRVGGDDS